MSAARHLRPELRSHLEQQLARDPRYPAAAAARNARLIFQLALESLVGIRESGGNNHGRLVELIQSTIGGASGEAWCMSGVQSGLAFAEAVTGILSPIAVSEHCLTVWRETPPAQRVKSSPLPGAIVIWRHGSSDSGHTGVTLTPCVDRRFSAVECNTESGVAGGRIERDGGGVYRTRRSQSGDGNMHVVGFLKPF